MKITIETLQPRLVFSFLLFDPEVFHELGGIDPIRAFQSLNALVNNIEVYLWIEAPLFPSNRKKNIK